MKRTTLVVATGTITLALLAGASAVFADSHPASPRGSAEAQIGGKDGKWISIDYGRPLLRGRSGIFGTGADYGKQVNGGAPVWRAGANATTRLKTELPITLGGKKLAAGEYDLFIELKEGAWTLIVSTQPALREYSNKDKTRIWGAYGYDPKFDVVRVPMTMGKSSDSVEQLTFEFVNVSDKGGTIEVEWDTTVASVPFTAG